MTATDWLTGIIKLSLDDPYALRCAAASAA
jgi:hypothetical protein